MNTQSKIRCRRGDMRWSTHEWVTDADGRTRCARCACHRNGRPKRFLLLAPPTTAREREDRAREADGYGR